MGLPDDDHRALVTRLAPAGTAAADKVAKAVDEGEELREIVVDAQGDVVAFTDRRALFVGGGAKKVVPVGYDAIELRQRDSGLGIDVLMERGRLILDVARGTFARLAVVGTGAPPGRASWLPIHQPPPRPEPAPPPPAAAAPSSAPSPSGYPTTPTTSNPPAPALAGPPMAPSPGPAQHQPAHGPRPTPPPAGLPPAGWHPDPAGRHWWRWWDGVDWTEHVADGGSPFVDPLPPRG